MIKIDELTDEQREQINAFRLRHDKTAEEVLEVLNNFGEVLNRVSKLYAEVYIPMLEKVQYIYSYKSNNWRKMHGIPLRRK